MGPCGFFFFPVGGGQVVNGDLCDAKSTHLYGSKCSLFITCVYLFQNINKRKKEKCHPVGGADAEECFLTLLV